MKLVAELLATPRFSNLRLLTDPITAEIPFDSIEITETPDIAHTIFLSIPLS